MGGAGNMYIWVDIFWSSLFWPDSEMLNQKIAKEHYEDIVQRLKLVDLAKAQAQELSILQAEVERLRMRTFPAFFDVQEI